MTYCNIVRYEIKSISCLFKPAERLLPATHKHVLALVQSKLNVTPLQLKDKSRERELVEARMMAAGLIYKYFPKVSKSDIGRLFDRDHSTVIYWLSTVDDLLYSDHKFKNTYLEIEKQILKLKGVQYDH